MQRWVRVAACPVMNKPVGWVTWEEHVAAHAAYVGSVDWLDFDRPETAEHVAATGGFTLPELIVYLGRMPATWHASNRPDEQPLPAVVEEPSGDLEAPAGCNSPTHEDDSGGSP